jgi:hypothetical protein
MVVPTATSNPPVGGKFMGATASSVRLQSIRGDDSVQVPDIGTQMPPDYCGGLELSTESGSFGIAVGIFATCLFFEVLYAGLGRLKVPAL